MQVFVKILKKKNRKFETKANFKNNNLSNKIYIYILNIPIANNIEEISSAVFEIGVLASYP